MSRHGRRGRNPHASHAPRPRPSAPAPAHDRPGFSPDPARAEAQRPPVVAPADTSPRPAPTPAPAPEAQPEPAPVAFTPAPLPTVAPDARPVADPRPAPAAAGPQPGGPRHDGEGQVDGQRPSCTPAQLRRFIKSRPWIPMHELRRRFGIYGGDDDVSPVRVGNQTLFVGLPAAEARVMQELLSGGDVGYELSLDPGAPIVVGVYPMRPVARG